MILKIAESEKIEFIRAGFSQQNENAQECGMEQCLLAAHRLLAICKFNVQKLLGAELPGATSYRFHLDGNGATLNAGRQQIVQRDVSGEGCSDVPTTSKFRSNKVLANLPRELIAVAACH